MQKNTFKSQFPPQVYLIVKHYLMFVVRESSLACMMMQSINDRRLSSLLTFLLCFFCFNFFCKINDTREMFPLSNFRLFCPRHTLIRSPSLSSVDNLLWFFWIFSLLLILAARCRRLPVIPWPRQPRQTQSSVKIIFYRKLQAKNKIWKLSMIVTSGSSSGGKESKKLINLRKSCALLLCCWKL